jgi:hypothetical protein
VWGLEGTWGIGIESVQKTRSAQAETIDLWFLGPGFTQDSDHFPKI